MACDHWAGNDITLPMLPNENTKQLVKRQIVWILLGAIISGHIHCGRTTLGGVDARAVAAFDVSAETQRDVSVVDTQEDERVDARFDHLFDPCQTSEDCRGLSEGTCFSNVGTRAFPIGFPNGLCTRLCTLDNECGEHGVCISFGWRQYCFPVCDHGRDCRPGYGCYRNVGAHDDNVCWPMCTIDSDCGEGAYCQPYTGYCQSEPYRPNGDRDGEPCLANQFRASNCTGHCLQETDYDAEREEYLPSGYIDGMCYSICRVPPSWIDPLELRFPQGECASGSVCIAAEYALAEPGDIGYCLRECHNDQDCRVGYQCFRRSFGQQQSENGFCTAIDCNDGVHRCPNGFRCRIGVDSEEPHQGRCER